MKLDSLINGRTIHFGGFYTVFVVKMISHHPLIENQKPIIHSFMCISVNPFTKRQILDSSKLKGFADNNYILMKIAESLVLKAGRKHCGERRNCSSRATFCSQVQYTSPTELKD